MCFKVIFNSFFLMILSLSRFERVWDPTLVPGAPKKISYNFLSSVRKIVCCSVIMNTDFQVSFWISSANFHSLQFEKWLSFDTNPLYALMHESIYCQVLLFLVPCLCIIYASPSTLVPPSLCRVLLVNGLPIVLGVKLKTSLMQLKLPKKDSLFFLQER